MAWSIIVKFIKLQCCLLICQVYWERKETKVVTYISIWLSLDVVNNKKILWIIIYFIGISIKPLLLHGCEILLLLLFLMFVFVNI